MSKEKIYIQNNSVYKNNSLDKESYKSLYDHSLREPKKFWQEQLTKYLTWEKIPKSICKSDFNNGEFEWFKDGKINASVNCIDRHLSKNGSKVAIIWEGDNPNDSKEITYNELHKSVCRFSNALKKSGINKGDTVCIYMPMIPEATYAMLACARIGAIHSVVFGGFSPEALKDRILDSNCSAVITANEGVRGSKKIPLKDNVDKALETCPNVHSVIVISRTKSKVNLTKNRDLIYEEIIKEVDDFCEPEPMSSEDPLFILYTSGSTGKPKGVLHTTGGYLLQAAMTHQIIFNYQEQDIYWCTADVGWITGHSYIVYGPLSNCATSLMFEGIPTYPDASRFWNIIDKHKVNIFYTAPTALRALMAQGNEFVNCTSRESLKLLGSVGEPINPEAWEWYYQVVGNSRCPIIDTWWQTETGGIMISPIAGVTDLKPGSATLPFFGVEPALLDEEGHEIKGQGEGNLVIKRSWPSQIRTVYDDHERCLDTYFSLNPGYYTTGDGARRDKDGYYWITGRVDDVLNVSGHRLGTAEIESSLVLHPNVAESAVVGYDHNIKGQGIYCYVTLMNGVDPSEEIKEALIELVKNEIGAIAKPDIIQWAPGLPKTRSGKIMRRILRKIASNDIKELGDISTLADPSVVQELITERKNNVIN
ncbi:MAG: acetate--CoA ligase [SAR86 cluster bacterium]|jgi:acetyl-CoA synthetase|nr:acetate--CoA ligase [SAR86 cluster bacterium]